MKLKEEWANLTTAFSDFRRDFDRFDAAISKEPGTSSEGTAAINEKCNEILSIVRAQKILSTSPLSTIRVYAKIQVDVPARYDLPESQREAAACQEIERRLASIENIQLTSSVYPHKNSR